MSPFRLSLCIFFGAVLFTVSSSFNLNDLVKEAQIKGWKCGHSSGRGGCFFTTSKYIFRLASACRRCAKSRESSVSQPTGSQDIEVHGTSIWCMECQRLAREAPKCGGKFLGIGSKRKGTSCKLIDGTGCWPLKTARVLHDCGKGAECAFKVSEAKAKVWCCRPRKSCKWYQAKCHWRNTFRCSNSALSKSKDKNGAQVLWE